MASLKAAIPHIERTAAEPRDKVSMLGVGDMTTSLTRTELPSSDIVPDLTDKLDDPSLAPLSDREGPHCSLLSPSLNATMSRQSRVCSQACDGPARPRCEIDHDIDSV